LLSWLQEKHKVEKRTKPSTDVSEEEEEEEEETDKKVSLC